MSHYKPVDILLGGNEVADGVCTLTVSVICLSRCSRQTWLSCTHTRQIPAPTPHPPVMGPFLPLTDLPFENKSGAFLVCYSCSQSCVFKMRGILPSGSNNIESACNAEMWVRSLGWEHPLEEGMATHSSILAWRIPWTEGPSGYTVHGVTNSWDTTER